MILNDDGRKFLCDQEGCRLDSYQDQGGVWTIGYGCTHNVEPDMTITPEQAEQLFELALQPVERAVSAAVLIPLEPHEFAALVSLAYNIGMTNFKDSTLLRNLNMGDKKAAAREFPKWAHVKGVFNQGLADRRMREMALFQSV